MTSYLDFEKPVADLEGKIAELKAMAASDQAVPMDEAVARLSGRAALAEDAGGAASAAPPLLRLHQDADLGVDTARGRPQVRRGSGAAGRLRPLQRPAGGHPGAGEGLEHRDPAQAQFRHGAARGLP